MNIFSEIVAYISNIFSSNAFLQGGFLLGIITSIALTLKGIPVKVWVFIKSKLQINLEFSSENYTSFEWVKNWLNAQEYTNRNKNWNFLHTYSLKDKTVGYGTHLVPYRKRRLWVTVTAKEHSAKNQVTNINIRCYSWGTKFLNALIHDIYEHRPKEDQNKIQVLEITSNGAWRLQSTSKIKYKELFYPNNEFDVISEDIDRFLKNKNWYQQHDIAHTRGYLLFGPPGTGKTSFIKAVASKFDFNIVLLKINDLTNQVSINESITNSLGVKKPYILVIEDVDTMLSGGLEEYLMGPASPIINDKKPEEKTCEAPEVKEKYNRTMGFSEILNALDGLISCPNTRLLIFTTNRPEKLDSALLRPGRIDKQILLGYATKEQIEKYYFHMFPDATFEEATLFLSKFTESTTMAFVREEILKEYNLKKYEN